MRLGRNCSKCGGGTDPGFLAELSPGTDGRQVAWHPGTARPAKSSYLGVDVNSDWSVRLDPEALEPVTYYKCLSCGYLEAYVG
jgi:hypothetical protein